MIVEILAAGPRPPIPGTPRPETIDSVSDLVGCCQRTCSRGGSIHVLLIQSPADRDGVMIGRDYLSTFTLRQHPWHRFDLGQLSSLYCRDPIAGVLLTGLRPGQCRSLLKTLSDLWDGVPVTGGYDLPARFRGQADGKTRVCLNMNCSYGRANPTPSFALPDSSSLGYPGNGPR